MIPWRHETTDVRAAAPRGHPGTLGGHGERDSRSSDRSEDCRPLAGAGRAAPQLDRGGVGPDPDELEPVEARGEGRGGGVVVPQAPSRPSGPTDSRPTSQAGAASGAVTAGLWTASGAMGWTHAGGPPEAEVWHRLEGAASADVDASVGVSPDAGQPCVPAGANGRCHAVPASVNKNSRPWDRARPSSSRMRRGSPVIPGWGGGGPSGASGCGFPRPASIMNGSTSRAGWRRGWGGTGW